MTYIAGTATAFPPHYCSQEELTAALLAVWSTERNSRFLERVKHFHQNVMVDGRYLALPLEAYTELSGFGARNQAWIEVAADLGTATLNALLEQAELDPQDVSQLTSTTVTGIATPSIDARLMNRIPFSSHLKRMPLFGLGCLAGVAGVARVADYLRGRPDEAAILLSIELCSLTIQREDLSVANMISSGLFGDGAAAVLLVGHEHPLAQNQQPRVVDSRSIFFPNTERVMGWDIVDTGFRIVLSAAVPEIARTKSRPAVEAFLAEHQLSIADISLWIAHPGGPKVIDALQEALGLDDEDLRLTRESLQRVGNVSSASVLFILEETLATRQPLPGSYGLMIAMGPAFCAELVLLQW